MTVVVYCLCLNRDQFDFYIAPKSHPNQFRPKFPDKDRILTSKTREIDITRIAPRHITEPIKARSPKQCQAQSIGETGQSSGGGDEAMGKGKPQMGKRKGRGKGKGKDKDKALRTEVKGKTPQERAKAARKREAKLKESRRKVSKADVESDEPRKAKEATRYDRRLRKKHPTKTLLVGSIHASLKRTLTVVSNNDVLAVANRLRYIADTLNQLRFHMYHVIALSIDNIVQKKRLPTGVWSLDSQDKSDLDDVVSNQSFYTELVAYLLEGQQGRSSRWERLKNAPQRTVSTRTISASAPRDRAPTPHSERAYQAFQQISNFEPFNKRQQAIHITPSVVRLAAKAVFSAMKAHYLNSTVRSPFRHRCRGRIYI